MIFIKYKTKNAGFTLVELLVVLSILALLISVIMSIFSEVRAKGRDARRLADVDQVRKALDLYAASSSFYPICGSETVINGVSDCLSTALISRQAMSTVPVDPLRGSGGVCGGAGEYVYCYRSLNGNSYTLRYATEVGGAVPAGWHTVVH